MPEVNPGTTGLVAWWALDSGALVTDSHGANTLTNSGVAEGAAKVGTASGDFEATENDLMSIADNAALSMGDIDFTITAWFKAESRFSTAMRVISKRQANTNGDFDLYIDVNGASGRVYWSIFDAVSGEGNVSYPYTLNAGTWYFVAVYHDASESAGGIRVDADTWNAASFGAKTARDSTADLYLGNLQQVARPWDGLIDEVTVWKNRVLTDDEVSWLYNSGNGRSYADLTGGAAGLPVIAWHHHQVFGG